MIDIQFIRDDSKSVVQKLLDKGVQADLDVIVNLDKEYRKLLQDLDDLRAQKNVANDAISQLIKEKKDPKEKIASMKEVSASIGTLEPKVKDLSANLTAQLMVLPNPAHESVPVGDISKNKIVRSWGEPKKFDFKPKSHVQLAESLDIIDFKRATKITGSNFIVFKGAGALLERALINFMLDIHTREHGYTEIAPPYLVNRDSMTGTGQLPKMEDDMYRLGEEDLFLIPTAEVPVTNLLRNEMIKEADLPIQYCAYTPCFRREAGSYGKETKGLIRVHQFDKVELVKFVKSEGSYEEHEKLTANAEKIFQLLGLSYRVVLLASGDLSFAAAKCFDIESFAPGSDQWLEVSSCSNFEDFQARRSNIRYKDKETNKTTFVHTLNGSGLALPRTVVAILENYQTESGEIIIPEVLRSYMGGLEKIVRK